MQSRNKLLFTDSDTAAPFLLPSVLIPVCVCAQGFFRRSIQQNIQYKKCLKNESCPIMRINRNRCQQCRFKKCLMVGMSRDCEYSTNICVVKNDQ